MNLRENFSVKLITGFRGTGKLNLLDMFAERLKLEGVNEEKIIFINFEEIEDFSNFQQLYLYINNRIADVDYAYLLFYGIHVVDGWEKAVNALFLGASVEIYIVDSNEKLLLEKLLAFLPDNLDVMKMYPMSFTKFMEASSVDNNRKIFEKTDIAYFLDKYLKLGGLPVIAQHLSDEKTSQKLLTGLLYEVLLKDITIKYSLRNSYLFQVILRFLAFNLGKPMKIKNLEKRFAEINLSVTPFTLNNYLNIIDESGVFRKISRYDVKNNVFLNGSEYYYCADSGICNALLNFKFQNETALIKNVVYLELLRQGYEVYCAKIGTMSADFFAISDKGKLCIQILPTHEKNSLTKFLRPLHKLPNNIEKLLISKESVEIKGSVKSISVVDFLLHRDYV